MRREAGYINPRVAATAAQNAAEADVALELLGKLSVVPNDPALGAGFANVGLDNNGNRYKGIFVSATAAVPRPGSGGGGPIAGLSVTDTGATDTGYLYVQNDDGSIFAGFPLFDPATAGGTGGFVMFGTHPWRFELDPLVGAASWKIFHEGNLTFGTGLSYDAVTGELTAPATGGATDLDGLTDVDTSTTAPVDGDLLKYDAASGHWKPAAPTSSSPWNWKPPTAAHFGTMVAALRSGSIVTFPPILTDDADVGLRMKTQADTTAGGTFTEKLFGRAIPVANQGGAFTFTVHMRSNLRLANDQVGIWVGDAATGKYVLFGLFCRGGNINIQRAKSTAGAWDDGVFSANWNEQGAWLRIVVANQTTSYYVSDDGKAWDLVYAAENLFAAPYKNYGFYFGCAVADVFSASCDYLSSEEYP